GLQWFGQLLLFGQYIQLYTNKHSVLNFTLFEYRFDAFNALIHSQVLVVGGLHFIDDFGDVFHTDAPFLELTSCSRSHFFTMNSSYHSVSPPSVTLYTNLKKPSLSYMLKIESFSGKRERVYL